jgi:hypothetical protein
MFGVQLSNITPAGAHLSKKDFILCHIVTDAGAVLQQAKLAQLLKKMEVKEECSYYD